MLGGAAAKALAPVTGTLGTAHRITSALARESAATFARPRHALDLAGQLTADAQAAGKLLLTPPEARGALKHDVGAVRSVAWSRPLSLSKVKAIAHAQDATVNDVLLAAVSGVLHDDMVAGGEEPRPIRAMVPVNLRPVDTSAAEQLGPAEQLGNRFGLVFLTLPVDRPAPRGRLLALKRRMDEIKHSPEGPLSYVMLEATGLTPAALERYIIDFFTAKASAVMTNVPGPRQTVHLAGSPVRTVLVWAPTAGSVGMSISIFSYAGRITVGLLAHADLVPDPQRILGRLPREIAAMDRLTPRAGPVGEAGPARKADPARKAGPVRKAGGNGTSRRRHA